MEMPGASPGWESTPEWESTMNAAVELLIEQQMLEL